MMQRSKLEEQNRESQTQRIISQTTHQMGLPVMYCKVENLKRKKNDFDHHVDEVRKYS